MLLTQPQGGPLEVDWESPITAVLSAAHVLGHAKRFDAVRRAVTVATGTKTNTVAGGLTSGFGAALGVGASDRVPTPYNKALTSRSTFFAGVRNGAGGGNLGRIYDKTSGSAGQFLYWSNTAILLQYGYFLGGSEQIVQIPGTGTTCAVGVPFTVLVTHNVVGTSQTINAWVNGNQVLTNATATGTMNDAAATVLSIGNRADGIRGWDGSIECGFVWDRILTADEARALHAARYQIFVDEDDEEELYRATAAGADTAINPVAGSATITGQAPTVSQSANQAIAPSAGSLAITGYAPTVAQSAHQSIAPAVGSISITGYAPSVTQSVAGSISPTTAAIAITGYAPTVTRTANQALTPAVKTLAITGYAPSITQGPLSVTPNFYGATTMRANSVYGQGAVTATNYGAALMRSTPVYSASVMISTINQTANL